MWHSCGRFTVEQFFRGKTAVARNLYRAFHRFVRAHCGPFIVDVAKTRIAFQGRVRFAGVVRANRDGLVIGFWLKRRIHSHRFTTVEAPMPHDFVYRLRLTRPEDLDDELLRWLREAYAVGQQQYSRS